MGFYFKNHQLIVDEIAVSDIANEYGTPLYLYSQKQLIQNWRAFDTSFAVLNTAPRHLVCFAVKANSNLAILKTLAQLGSGFDIVSGGELARVLKAGGDANKVVFSGVGKRDDEILMALKAGIKCFNVESEQELYRIHSIAQQENLIARISFRINPNIDAHTHPYISTGLSENKFGITVDEALRLYDLAHRLSHIQVVGIDCHIGSQLTDLSPFKEAALKVRHMIDTLICRGIPLKHVDFGGGLGVSYDGKSVPSIQDYVKILVEVMQDYPELEILIEPGRAICADAGILVTKVEYIKKHGTKYFAIVDTGMHQMIRPALYHAEMRIIEVNQMVRPSQCYDVVGPICESSDFLGKNRKLQIQQGDLLAMLDAGAYGAAMSSAYNSQVAASEVMVCGNTVKIIKARPSLESLWQGENMDLS
ncbi:diaminopimelate decarboxylase [Actinobacillus delphinicola]|uniref:Diaminopimelate decarboxylase n=1 Tax=Actinobacillus delphinicola TaxID=51161 RepID=A0A448TTY8_9PAST|nr:diaminopimelate decarboxylase [Actinobacillus delphinicola]VEJ09462.1 diaminopimelate decarboxylase [Actinobacillus delphinicola]